mgnify:CR=1 FL=1|tara:strand:- start:2323 stop:2463 length:141 start_codon:yes stop_codon:yes gene_type:complete
MKTCSQCGVTYFISPYHTADMKHTFCGAECSVKWYAENRREEVKNG